MYSRGKRHQPELSRHIRVDARLWRLFRRDALFVERRSDASTRDSGLEQLVKHWNDLPGHMTDISYSQLKKVLSDGDYHANTTDYQDLMRAIRVL